MNSAAPPRLRRWALLTALLPILLLAVYIARGFATSNADDLGSARATAAEAAPLPAGVCRFPGEGAERARLAFIIIDSLRYDTAMNPALMPFVSSLPGQSLHGRMKPCLSQLSLLCMRTMLEGREPLLVTGLSNFTGMQVQAPSLVAQLGAHGARAAMVADGPLVSLYRTSLTEARAFEDRQDLKLDRDLYARSSALAWLDDRSLDAVLTLIVDTDGIAHREGIHTAAYAEKFREADETVREIAARLGPRDTLFVLGDHGHDPEGHHSTGIDAPTAYFARGPMFPPGQRLDTDMATTRFFLGMATCTPVSAGYDGQAPLDALRVPDGYREATRELMAKLPHKEKEGEESWLGAIGRWLPIGVLIVAFLGLIRRAGDAPETLARPVMLNVALLGAGFVIPPAIALWLAAGANVVLGVLWSRRAGAATVPAPLQRLAWAGLAVQVLIGVVAHRVLVPLQDHVNSVWQASFAAALIAATLLCAALLRGVLHAGFGLAAGWASWGLTFFGLFLGPYYYGSARNVLFGVTWLVLASAGRRLARDRAVLRDVTLALVPLIPLHLPLMKEWKLRYMFLDDAMPLPVLLGVLAGLAALAIALSPARAVWRRALPLFAVFLALGFATQLPRGTLLAGALLFFSYQGFCGCARALSGAAAPNAADAGAAGAAEKDWMARWLTPAGQVSYAFMMFFVLLRGIRFANISFEFTLSLMPVGRGEAVAALVGMPLVLLKYCGPVVLLLASGDRPGAPALHLLLYKLAAGTAFLAGMELAAVPSAGLFSRLLTQEITLLVYLYAAAVLAAAFAVGRLPAARPSAQSMTPGRS